MGVYLHLVAFYHNRDNWTPMDKFLPLNSRDRRLIM